MNNLNFTPEQIDLVLKALADLPYDRAMAEGFRNDAKCFIADSLAAGLTGRSREDFLRSHPKVGAMCRQLEDECTILRGKLIEYRNSLPKPEACDSEPHARAI